jgi:sugar lactone lactonase YvrE
MQAARRLQVNRETPSVELLVDAHAVVGEGPFWHPDEEVLYWVDIMGHLVHRYDPARAQDTTIDVGQAVGAARPRASGGLVLAVQDGFAALDPATGRVEMLAEVEKSNADNRMNDGACDSAGRFWAGTMSFSERAGAGSLYRLETDHRVTKLLDNLTISNGIGWSPDDRLMYYIDSRTLGLDVFDFERASGAISNRRRLATTNMEGAVPDGLAVDAEGYIWVALWGGWAVHRYAPDGQLDRAISLPVSQVSACAFGGPNLQDLYITSATNNLSAEQRSREPNAGGLFRCRPGVRGLPTHSYRG